MLLKMMLKKAVYDKLVAKINNIDTSDFVLKTKYQTDKTELEEKIPDVTDFVKKKQNSLNQKTKFQMLVIQQQKLHYVQLKIKYLMLVVQLKKANYDTKISELEKKLTDHNNEKYVTTPEFNILAAVLMQD